MTEEYQPKYRWKETWPGEGHKDYVGMDGEQMFGRIQLDKTSDGKVGMWKWNSGHVHWIKERILPQSGWVETAREACHAVEEHYEKLKVLHGKR